MNSVAYHPSAASYQLMDASDLPWRLHREIEKRTWGRVRHLRVEGDRSRIVVHGFTSSYYLKQLVLQAILESFGGVPAVPVSLDIKVGTSAGNEVQESAFGAKSVGSV
jgi:hypothetical protein